jgi:electron transport complex protein RnfG
VVTPGWFDTPEDGEIGDCNRSFMELTDTPGFGQKAKEPAFYSQFTGKSANDPFEVKGDVQVISGATITSRGVASILKYASFVAGEYLVQHGGVAGTGKAPVIQETAAPFSYEDAYISLFPAEEYPDAVFTENSENVNRLVRNMRIVKETVVTVDDTAVGALAAAQGQTYHGAGVVLAGVTTPGTLRGAHIIELNDTPNVGQLALEKDFYSQFTGKDAIGTLLVAGEWPDIDSLSGATITGACVADMVKVAAVEATKLLAMATGTELSSGIDDFPLNEIYFED